MQTQAPFPAQRLIAAGKPPGLVELVVGALPPQPLAAHLLRTVEAQIAAAAHRLVVLYLSLLWAAKLLVQAWGVV